jgi:beta-glucosidase
MLNIPATVGKDKNVKVNVRVTNTGKMDGEEVVQLYLQHQDPPGKTPLKALKGFQRIALKKGESKTVNFELTPEQLSLVNENGMSYQAQGKILISVGGGQPGVKNKATSNTVNKIITVL